jgi:ketopantoate reductase
MAKLSITICGCGNGAHACAAMISSKGHDVNIYSPIQEEIDRFIEAGDYKLNAILPDKSEITTELNIITSDASEVIPDSSIIFIIVPAFAHENVLRNISKYITENSLIVTIPTRSGFEFEATNILPKCNIIGLQTLPWACRIEEFGKKVNIIGRKIEIQVGSLPATISSVLLYEIEKLLDIKFSIVKSMLTLTLGNVGQIIHPGIMYGIFGENSDIKFEENDIPLFYQSVDENIAKILKTMSNEIQDTTNKLYENNNEVVDPSEVLTIDEWILQSYGDQIQDKSSLAKMFSTNSAYQGLKVPVKKVEGDLYAPDFRTRYVLEDIPYGLLIIKSIAQIVDVKTPQIDKVINTLGNLVGENYMALLESVNRIAKISRLPMLYGIRTMKDMEKIYL